MKTCSRCLVEKAVNEFHKRTRSSDGLSVWCKPCQASYYKGYQVKNLYGLTIEEYEAMMLDAVCEICGSDKNLGLDHCHTSGKPRGVLCFNCNSGIGKFYDNPVLLENAREYLCKK